MNWKKKSLNNFICHLSWLTVSSMAKWLRCLLAEWKVLGSNLTLGKVSEKVLVKKSFGKKKASYPLLA